MGSRRVYIALTHAQVRELAASRTLRAPLRAWAAGVTGRVDGRISPAAAQEESEYLAFRSAAADAADAPPVATGSRRVIASADVPVAALREVGSDAGMSEPVPVLVAEDLPLRSIASLHVDEAGEQAAEIGEAAPADIGEAAPQNGEADLLWYDITELDLVLTELDSSDPTSLEH